jgi:4-hydroxybenzoate polyprenyltransferase
VGTFLRLIRFSHTLFALPYAVAGFVIGAREARPPLARGLAIAGLALVAIVCARTAAMTFNRLADRRFDATNPRTRSRPSVTGEISPRAMAWATAAAGAVFVAASFLLGPLCGVLSFVAIAVVLLYSYTKRVTPLSHFVLGAALGLAPIGAYLSVTGAFGPATGGMVLLSASVALWTAGFDILYACQDVDHDRREELFSIPRSVGIPNALLIARACHALVLAGLAAAARALGLGIVFSMGVVAAGILLVIEHALVRADDLSRVGAAFFQVNVLVSVVVMAAVVLDVWIG